MMNEQTVIKPPRAFINLAMTTTLFTVGLITFGGIVRVTDSGLGCGNSWPLCNGTIFPPLDNVTAWIEWSHRLIAIAIGLLGIGMLVFAWQGYRRNNPTVMTITLVAAALYAFQSGLGAIVVIFDLPPTMVTLHLASAMLLLGALLVSAILAWHRPPSRPTSRDNVTTLAYVTMALSLIIILTGALVRGSGATLACPDYPLCNGEILPFNQGALETVHMMHRLAVVGLGFMLIMLVWYVYRGGRSALLRRLSLLALVLYFTQAGVGALFVLTSASPIWGASHVALASSVWALLVAISAIDTLNSQQSIGNIAPAVA
ncbi:MAG: COX15/CtaA family protein [Phototrophicales bacterium]|nr:COX15/CtaA family protein [Phototrophicales bacterium]